jgi:hypothetical protein
MEKQGAGATRVEVEETEPVHRAVLRAVSAATDESPTDLPPLQERISVGAMDTLFASSTGVSSMRFEYMEFEITVEPEQVAIEEPSEATTDS